MKSPIFCCLESHGTPNGSLYGRFLLGPLPIDLSLTVGTTLRRGLLHSQPSLGIVSARIRGAVHEYAALPGVQESVLELLLNLGEVVLSTTHANVLEPNFRAIQLSGPCIAYLTSSGPGVVKAKDINWPPGIYCVNPDTHIATLSTNGALTMRIKIMAAFEDQASYLQSLYKTQKMLKEQAEKEKKERDKLKKKLKKVLPGPLPKNVKNPDFFALAEPIEGLDVELPVSRSLYPVQKVNFVIERDDQWEGYRHRILLEIWTNGTITPRQAIMDAVDWTKKILYVFRGPTEFRVPSGSA